PYVYVGSGNIGLAPIDITVRAGQHLDLGTCLRLDLTIPTHFPSQQLNLAGAVLTQCGNNVTNISYQVNGGAPTTVCNNCGANPNFNVTAALIVGANNLTVTARDDQGNISSVSGSIQVEPAPPVLSISLTSINSIMVSWPSSATGFT